MDDVVVKGRQPISETTTAIPLKTFSRSESQDSRPAVNWKAEVLALADLDNDPCRRARDAEE